MISLLVPLTIDFIAGRGWVTIDCDHYIACGCILIS